MTSINGKARRHLLVTNDFPPKVGGIQSALIEVYRRLPPEDVVVIAPSHRGDESFDSLLDFPVIRLDTKVIAPTPATIARVNQVCRDYGVQSVAFNPMLPTSLIAKFIDVERKTTLFWGAEVVIPAGLAPTRPLIRYATGKVDDFVSCADYTIADLSRLSGVDISKKATAIHPGIDLGKFTYQGDKSIFRRKLGIYEDSFVVVSLSRLVPRKGMDTLIKAASIASREIPKLQVVIGGEGRELARLESLAQSHSAPIHFLGRVSNEDIDAFYNCGDLFAMLCYNRWFNLEQEGFGIVFLEAAACGLPAIAGKSGGSSEAVVDGVTGTVLDDPRNPLAVAEAMVRYYKDSELRASHSEQARNRVVTDFSYEEIASKWKNFLYL
ncbi:MAG: glycosyltransferase family 4 protein [Actinomycetota bacterium]|nr:glycosyltransferase family 4 protein [Actinomycetota bacterium]